MISRIGKSQRVQKFINKTGDKKFYEKLNHNIPIIESGYITAWYTGAILVKKDIPKDRKKPLVYQSLIGGGAGMILSKKIDALIKKHNVGLCNEIEKIGMKDSKKILQGTRIFIPMMITTLIMRYGVSVLSVPISSIMNKYIEKNKAKVDTLA